ncbi:MAG: hypothetical protein HY088_01050 [Ignavibacteriales bacterium]|nr:hypothetical protein [Ignavibacteriales bacterium]
MRHLFGASLPAAGRFYGSVLWNSALRTESKKREMLKSAKVGVIMAPLQRGL